MTNHDRITFQNTLGEGTKHGQHVYGATIDIDGLHLAESVRLVDEAKERLVGQARGKLISMDVAQITSFWHDGNPRAVVYITVVSEA